MKLFSKTKPAAPGEENKLAPRREKYDSAAGAVVIISPRKAVLSEIASHLVMHNIVNVVEVKEDFLTLQKEDVLKNAAVGIIDIANADDITLINDKILMSIPAQARVFIVGDNDSIAFAESLMQGANLSYLHAGSQLTQLAGYIQAKDSGQTARSTIMVSVLGCKGGVGASTVAWRLFQAAGNQSAIPMLLAQGASGSRDLDLLMEQALPADGSSHQFSTHQSVYMETIDSMLNYHDARFKQFNLVFIDQMLQSLSNDQQDLIMSSSQTLILVITRELASVRMAKKILDDNHRRARRGSTARVLICLNENRPRHGRELKNSDIEEYLEYEIAVVNPYAEKNSALTAASPLFQFAAYLLGKTVVQTPKNKLLALFQRGSAA